MKRPRAQHPMSSPNTHGDRNKRRASEKVAYQQRRRLENEMHYHAGSSWKQFQTDGAVVKRHAELARAIPVMSFVEGIVFKGVSHWDK